MLGHRSYKTTFSSNCHGTVSVAVAIETACWKRNQRLVAEQSLVYLWSDFYYSSNTKKINSFLSCAEPYEVNLTFETSQQLTRIRKAVHWSSIVYSQAHGSKTYGQNQYLSPFIFPCLFSYHSLACVTHLATEEMYQITCSLLWSSKILFATFFTHSEVSPQTCKHTEMCRVGRVIPSVGSSKSRHPLYIIDLDQNPPSYHKHATQTLHI